MKLKNIAKVFMWIAIVLFVLVFGGVAVFFVKEGNAKALAQDFCDKLKPGDDLILLESQLGTYGHYKTFALDDAGDIIETFDGKTKVFVAKDFKRPQGKLSVWFKFGPRVDMCNIAYSDKKIVSAKIHVHHVP